ncbi:coagulation factor XIII B chain-like [Salarias fasciatus]|uniref:coagulation factor XIII B chain-like n=1 Tax=Salarias fasciatus TaxID=181472 RepID=UPI0011769A1E|nr:coagulation factor XIII B chain-like [Salarias fasciatus]
MGYTGTWPPTLPDQRNPHTKQEEAALGPRRWRTQGDSSSWDRCGGMLGETVIENGRVLGDATEYGENEILNYRCDEQFKVANGIPSKCTKVGQIADWIPTPMCEQIRCHLPLPPLRGTTYEPAFKSVFFPGETVTVTCGSTYWIERTDKTFTEATCKGDGEWNIRPVCQEVICSNQRDQFVSYWGVYYWHQKKLGDTASYACKRGYKSQLRDSLSSMSWVFPGASYRWDMPVNTPLLRFP